MNVFKFRNLVSCVLHCLWCPFLLHKRLMNDVFLLTIGIRPSVFFKFEMLLFELMCLFRFPQRGKAKFHSNYLTFRGHFL